MAGRISQRDNLVGRSEIFQSNTQTTKPELIQSFEESLCILQIEANPEVEIAGLPRMAVGRQSIAPHNQVFNLV